MPCVNTVLAYQERVGAPLKFRRPKVITDGIRVYELGCGKCQDCRERRARDLSTRLIHETKLHPSHLCHFVTATFDEKSLPADGSVDRREAHRFVKRIRNGLIRRFRNEVRQAAVARQVAYAAEAGQTLDNSPELRRLVRRTRRAKVEVPAHVGQFQHCLVGEYGEVAGRCHYHLLLYGVHLADLKPAGRGVGGDELMSSAFLEEAWQHRGMVRVGRVTPKSCRYVAGYLVKKLADAVDGEAYGERDLVHPGTGDVRRVNLQREFCSMSRRPAIGLGWLERFGMDAVPSGFIIIDGKRQPVPDYYIRKLTAEESLVARERTQANRPALHAMRERVGQDAIAKMKADNEARAIAAAHREVELALDRNARMPAVDEFAGQQRRNLLLAVDGDERRAAEVHREILRERAATKSRSAKIRRDRFKREMA